MALTNPLLAYKNVTGMSWRDLILRTGLSSTQIQRIARMSPKEILGVSFVTHFKLLDTLGIDLLAYAGTADTRSKSLKRGKRREPVAT